MEMGAGGEPARILVKKPVDSTLSCESPMDRALDGFAYLGGRHAVVTAIIRRIRAIPDAVLFNNQELAGPQISTDQTGRLREGHFVPIIIVFQHPRIEVSAIDVPKGR